MFHKLFLIIKFNNYIISIKLLKSKKLLIILIILSVGLSESCILNYKVYENKITNKLYHILNSFLLLFKNL